MSLFKVVGIDFRTRLHKAAGGYAFAMIDIIPARTNLHRSNRPAPSLITQAGVRFRQVKMVGLREAHIRWVPSVRTVSTRVDVWSRDRDAPPEADIYTHLFHTYSADRPRLKMTTNDTNGLG